MAYLSRKELSKDLTTFTKNNLKPSPKFERLGRLATSKIFKALQTQGQRWFSIARVKTGGSMGKGTAIADTDFDLVVFLNDVEPPFDPELLECMKKAIKGLDGYEFKRTTKFSVQFKLWVEGIELNFDLLPAANLLSQRRLQEISNIESAQATAVRRRLKKHIESYAETGYCLSSSLCEQTVLFLKKRPKAIIDVIKLAKYWNQQITGMPYISGRSYLIELVAAHAQRKQKGCSLLQRFVRFLRFMKNFDTLHVVFNHHYNSSSIPKSVLMQKPLILDPCNPYNNIVFNIKNIAIKKYKEQAAATLDLIKSGNIEHFSELFMPYCEVEV